MKPLYHLFKASLSLIAAVTSLHAASDYSTPYVFTTLAGTSSIGSSDGTGEAARFYSPYDVTTDSVGNLFVVDEGNHTIRKITPTGTVTTFAGSPGIPGSNDGTGTEARFDSPQGIVADSSDNLFVTDTGNHTIRKISPLGDVVTLAGLTKIPGGNDGNTNTARFNFPRGIAIDNNGNLFVTEAGNETIRRVTPSGDTTTILTGVSFLESFNGAYGAITVDADGNLYISHFAFTTPYTHGANVSNYYNLSVGYVSKIPPLGVDARLWQTSVYHYFDGRISNHGVYDLEAVTPGNFIYMQHQQIRRYPSYAVITGTGEIGSIDGPPTTARFSSSARFTLSNDGTIYVADTGNNNIRKVTPDGTVSTLAGLALEKASGNHDGNRSTARFTQPSGSAVDQAGNVYITDPAQHCIRKISPEGMVTTIAGSPGQSGFSDGQNNDARFNQPSGIAIDTFGNLFVADTYNHVIRKISPSGLVTTLAGSASQPGWEDGANSSARFFFPQGIAVDAMGHIYVTSAATVRKLTPEGQTSTLAGYKSEHDYIDGNGTAARFTIPSGITVDTLGNVYVSEAPGSPSIARIRKISPAGQVSTVAGSEIGYNDGPAATARFNRPLDLAVTANGDLFVADTNNQVIRKITATGAVGTIAGLDDGPGDKEGNGRDARFYYPNSIAIDQSGQLYVTSGTTVKKGQIAALPVITTQPGNDTVSSGGSAQFSVTAAGNPTPTYQWQYNGEPINGATSSTLTIANTRTTDAGDYTVVVTNELGSVTSKVAKLTVTAVSTPSAPPGASSGGGGGGAPSIWFLGFVGAAALIRFFLILPSQHRVQCS